ncbi:MAG: hypothetical protein ACFFB2_03330 [Promethearchaeota archaeon]
MTKKFPRPWFINVTPETERLKELGHFWIVMDQCRHLNLWRFSFLSDDETGEFIATGEGRFYKSVLMIHGHGTKHKIFNWLSRELWYFGFRKLFAIDNEQAEFTLICDELPRMDYGIIIGKSQEWVDLTIYTYTS